MEDGELFFGSVHVISSCRDWWRKELLLHFNFLLKEMLKSQRVFTLDSPDSPYSGTSKFM